MVENFENLPPMAAPSHKMDERSLQKRLRHEASEIPTGDKRPRQNKTHAHLNRLPQQSQRSPDLTQSTDHAPSSVYDPSIGTYTLLPHQSATPAAPDSCIAFGETSPPGLARYEQRLLNPCGSTAPSAPVFAYTSLIPERSAVPQSNILPLPTCEPRQQHDQTEITGNPGAFVPEYHTGFVEPPRGTQQNPVELLSSPEPEIQIKKKRNMKGKKKFYAVAAGHVPGVYTEWSEVEKQIKGYSGNSHHGFATEAEARAWLESNKIVRKPQIHHGGDFAATTRTDTQFHRSPFPIQSLPTPDAEQFLPQSGTYSQVSISNGSGMQMKSDAADFLSFPSSTQSIAPSLNENASFFNPVSEPILTAEQQTVVELIVKENRNVFYTGSAGCVRLVFVQ
jgi:hypothetical protein